MPAGRPISATWSTIRPSAANVAYYARIIRERALLRRLIEVGNEIASSAYRPEGRPIAELVDEAERRVFEIARAGPAAWLRLYPAE